MPDPTNEARRLAPMPCPFCGEAERLNMDDYRTDGVTRYCVRCPCGAETATGATIAAAVVIWNRRPPQPAPEPPATSAEVERAVALVKREARHLFDLTDEAEDMAHLSMAIDALAALTKALPKWEVRNLLDAWDTSVLPKANDGRLQEAVECLRATHAAPALDATKGGA